MNPGNIEDVVKLVKPHMTVKEVETLQELIREHWMTDDRIDKEYEAGMKVGKRDAQDAIRNDFKKRAADLFIENKDDEARAMRKLAESISIM